MIFFRKQKKLWESYKKVIKSLFDFFKYIFCHKYESKEMKGGIKWDLRYEGL